MARARHSDEQDDVAIIARFNTGVLQRGAERPVGVSPVVGDSFQSFQRRHQRNHRVPTQKGDPVLKPILMPCVFEQQTVLPCSGND